MFSAGVGNARPAPASQVALSSQRRARPLIRSHATAKERSDRAVSGDGRDRQEPSTTGKVSQDVVTMFKEAQMNVMELNRSRVKALNELKDARNRIAELEHELAAVKRSKGMDPTSVASTSAGAPAAASGSASGSTGTRDVLVDSIVLLYSTGWDRAFIHYDGGKGWTKAPGVPMTEKYQGYEQWKAITVPFPSIQFVLCNGDNVWDGPFGGGNYKITEPGIYRLKSGKLEKVEA